MTYGTRKASAGKEIRAAAALGTTLETSSAFHLRGAPSVAFFLIPSVNDATTFEYRLEWSLDNTTWFEDSAGEQVLTMANYQSATTNLKVKAQAPVADFVRMKIKRTGGTGTTLAIEAGTGVAF